MANFVSCLLCYDPADRMSAQQCCAHPLLRRNELAFRRRVRRAADAVSAAKRAREALLAAHEAEKKVS